MEKVRAGAQPIYFGMPGQEDEYPLATRRLHYVRQTALKMLRARGYAVCEEDTALSIEDFVKQFSLEPARENLNYTTCAVDSLEDRVLLQFPESGKLTAGNMKEVVEAMDVAGAASTVVVLTEKPSAFARLAVDQVAPKYRLDVFQEDELLVDITEHSLVPEHTLLTEAEVEAVLARYRATLLQLPRMRADDPIARYYGARRGQVFKVLRVNDKGSRYVNYRVVL